LKILIIGFGRRELTPEEIEESDAFIKYLREKEAAEKEVVDNLNLLANSIVKRMEPIKEFRLPKILENPRHWTPRNWKPKMKNFDNINRNFFDKNRNHQ